MLSQGFFVNLPTNLLITDKMTKKQSIQLFEEKKRDPELSKGWGQIVTPLSVQLISEMARR